MPFVCVDNRGEPLATIRDEDSCICFNFRADRVRQITRALTRNSGLNEQGGRDLPGADDLDAAIPRDRVPKNLHYVCMTQYDKKFIAPGRDSAGIAGQHSGQRHGPGEPAQPARGRNRESTRTSPTSSTAESNSRFPEKTACWCRHPKSRPTT